MGADSSRRQRWVRRWLVALNGTLLVAGIYLAITWSPRALVLVVGVPVAFVPFARARFWFERTLASRISSAAVLDAISVLCAAADAVMVAQLLTARGPAPADWLHGHLVGWTGAVWFSSFAILAIARGVDRLLLTPLRRLAVRVRPTADEPADPGRRRFLQQASVLGAGAPFAASVAGANISYDFRLDEHDVPLPHWPRELDGLRVVHLSDIHVGGAMDRARLLRVAALANSARPDLVVHTGDFLTHRDGDFDAPLYEALARIQAPYGQWACLGNHDFDNPQRLVHKLEEAGVHTLRNRVARISIDGRDLEIAGLDFVFDRGALAERYADILAGWGPRHGVPRILLNHNPTAFPSLPEGCADLVCSGHTHGGQIGVQLGVGRALTFVGLVGYPDQGLFARGDTRLFVTRCVGFYGYPMRIGIPPEISLLRIRRGDAATTEA